MRYPKKLKSKISFIAPSFGCTFTPYTERLEASIKKLPYEIKVYDNCYKSVLPYRSNTKESCAKEFLDAYKDDSEVIMSVGGGEYMVEILDCIDFEFIKSLEPKWFMGYSDNTNLTFLLTTMLDIASIYGPNAPTFGIESHQSIDDSLLLLTNSINTLKSYKYYESNSKERPTPLSGYNLDTLSKYYINKCSSVTGRLIGGCLDIIINLIGTKYDKVSEFLEKYKDDGFIWFLEACDLSVISVKRAFKQLENAGYFKYVKGFIIGKPLQTEEQFGINHLDSYLEIISKYDCLIVGDADLGHVCPSMPIICGSLGTLTTSNDEYELKMELK